MLIDKTMTNANQEEMNQEEEVTQDEYETDTSTGEVEETAEESEALDAGEETDDTVTISKSDYEKLQRGLARKARIESKGKGKESSQESEGNYDQDLISRTYLAAQIGVTDADIQDQALEMAKKMNMKLPEAAKDSFFMDRIKHLQKQKQTQAGIAGNGGQNTAKPKSVDSYVAEFNKTGNLPDDPRLVSKILDALTKK